MSEKHGGFVFYHYTPNIAAAVIFTLIFGASSLFHIWQVFKNRTWYFIPMVIGCLMSAVGYAARGVSHNDPEALNPYIMQNVLLLVAPALFAASIYVILGRLIRLVQAEEYSLVRINWLTKFFVLGDVLSFLMQSTGGGLMAKSMENAKLGQNIIIGGLIIQLLFFGFFIVVITIFHRRIHAEPTRASMMPFGHYTWKTMLYVLYLASALIMVRSVFRVVEYIQGHDGYLMSREIYLYIFDAVLMSIVVILFNVVHPSKVLPNKKTYNVTATSAERYPMAAV